MTLQKIKWVLTRTVQRQLITGMVLVVALMMSLLVWDTTRRQQEASVELQAEQIKALASSVATSSSVWLASRDYSGLQEIVHGVAAYPDLRHAMVLDLKGQVLAHNDPSRVGLYLADLPLSAEPSMLQRTDHLLDIATPIKIAGKHIGWVRIGLAPESFNAERARVVRNGVIYAVVAILLTIFVALLTGRYLTYRLNVIQGVADSVEAGKVGLRAELDGEDEAARLATQFNRMLDTLEQRENALHASERKLDTMLQTIAEGLVSINLEGQIVYSNKTAEEILNISVDKITGKYFQSTEWRQIDERGEAFPQEKLPLAIALTEQHSVFNVEHGIVAPDGKIKWLSVNAAPLHDATGKMVGGIASFRDISQRKQVEERLKLAASVFTHAREGILITDPEGVIVDVNDMFTYITHFSRSDAIGNTPKILSSGKHDRFFYAAFWRALTQDGHWQGEIWNRRKNGEIYAGMQTVSAVRDDHGKTINYVALFSDVTSSKEHELHLEHIAHYDALTNLANRVLLSDRLHQGMTQAQRRGQPLAVAYLDLDGFKAINDSFGHDAGDQLLITVASRMKQSLREGDTLARLGGDEFVAVLLDFGDIDVCGPMLSRLLAAAAEPVLWNGRALKVSASVGVTFYPQSQEIDADQLLRQADQAMYQAKLAGKNQYYVFDSKT